MCIYECIWTHVFLCPSSRQYSSRHTLLDSILLDSFVGQLGSGIGCTLQISQETLDFNICLILTLEIQD